MLPWLQLVELISSQGKGLPQLVGKRVVTYICNGEINYWVSGAEHLVQSVNLKLYDGRYPSELGGLAHGSVFGKFRTVVAVKY